MGRWYWGIARRRRSSKHWGKYGHEYQACNRPGYFVKSAEYEPSYHAHQDHGHHGDEEEHGHHHD